MNISDFFKNLFSKPARDYSKMDVPVNSFPENNQGIIPGPQQLLGNYGAADQKIPYQINLPSGDWRDFVPIGEQQYYNPLTYSPAVNAPVFDTMACTDYSNNNLAEVALKQATGLEFNFSDRALSVLSETTKNGNYLSKVADVGRNIGRILESDYPDGGATSWDDYNKPLPPDLLKKAFRFNEQYQWVKTDKATLQYYLKQSPIQIIINNQTHAVCLVHVDDSGFWYYDSYPPYLKKMTVLPDYALQIIVKPMTQFVKKKGTGEFGFYVPAPDVSALKARGEQLGYPIVDAAGNVAWDKAKEFTLN